MINQFLVLHCCPSFTGGSFMVTRESLLTLVSDVLFLEVNRWSGNSSSCLQEHNAINIIIGINNKVEFFMVIKILVYPGQVIKKI
jgi:hypothetical protein